MPATNRFVLASSTLRPIFEPPKRGDAELKYSRSPRLCVFAVKMTKAILLDIEGTTTPIDFVHKKLFPFASARMAEFIRENFDFLKGEIRQLVEEHTEFKDSDDLYANEPDSVSTYLTHLIKIDRKSTPLKSIQGKIWQAGYESGELRSEIFDDVPPAFRRWQAMGRTIAIYSSGSVLAQKLLFKYTDHGDLTPFISAYFDTTTGGKKESESYRKITAELALQPQEILFLSDVLAELDAAKGVGLQTVLSIRKGNAKVVSEHGHKSIESFDQVPG